MIRNIERDPRKRRARKVRGKIQRLGAERGIARMNVFRSGQHIRVQVLSAVGGMVLAEASSNSVQLRQAQASDPTFPKGKIGMAMRVGQLLAERALAANIQQVASDCSGFRYHGRIAALVEAVRNHGIQV